VDFPPAFLVIGALAATAALIFYRLAPDAGEELSGQKATQARLAEAEVTVKRKEI
jgi:hypothetical protein